MTEVAAVPAAPTADDVLFPTELRFPIGEREAVLKPLMIAEARAMTQDLATIAQTIIREHPEIELTRIDEHVAVLMPILVEWLGRILERITGIEAEYVEAHLGFAQASAIVVGLLRVNQVPVIRGNVLEAQRLLKEIA